MNVWKSIRRLLESALVLLGAAVIPFLPRWVILGLARVLGALGRICDRKLYRVALANLDLAFGETRSLHEKRDILKQAYGVFALLLLDLFWFACFSRRRMQRLVTFDESIRHYDETRPALLVTAHFGNWEVMGQSMVLRGDPISSVATPIGNPVAEFFLGRVRRLTGQQMATRAGAAKAMLGALRKGGRIALLLDQNTLPREGGVFVNFFGVPVPVSRAVGSLARHTGAPAVVGYCVVGPGGTYKVFAQAPMRLDGLDEVAATQAVLDRIEAVIRTYPGQWLWMYKRWKYVPEGAARERYPYYARSAPAAGEEN